MDTLEGEALVHHPAMGSKFLFLKLPHERESPGKMRLPLAKAIKHIPCRKNSEFLLFVFYSRVNIFFSNTMYLCVYWICRLRNSRGSQHWHEKGTHHDSQRSPSAPAKTGNEYSHTKKNVVASSLSSASPPFYPSVSSSNLAHGIQVGMEKLHTNENATSSGKKYRNTKSVYLPVNTARNVQSTSQGRGAPAAGNVFYHQSHSRGDNMQLNGDSKGTGQSYTRSSTQNTSSSKNRYPPGEIESASETGASFGKGKGTLQPSGSGSLMYSGSHVMGRAESLPSGDNSNFPAFLPGKFFLEDTFLSAMDYLKRIS